MERDCRDTGPAAGPPTGDSAQDASGRSILARLREQRGILPRVMLRDEPSDSGVRIVEPLAHEEQSPPGAAGKYQFQGVVARGGVGVVLKGHDTDLGRDVALKLLHDRYRDQPEMTQRFVEEAQIGGQLQHPGIVPVYDLGMQGDRPFFTMRLIKGHTLASLLEDRDDLSSDRRRVLSIFEHVCETMAYAHARGVIHRDLKPANIMVGAFGEVQVVDWGMGKVLPPSSGDDEERPTTSADLSVVATVRSQPGSVGSQSLVGSVMGTPAYMPPEQATGDVERMDERSDVFALGAMLAEIVTGRPPYPGDPIDALRCAATADLGPCRERLRACDADEGLVRLALDCLETESGDRPRSVALVAKRVATYLADLDERSRRAELEAAKAVADAASEQRKLEREQARAGWEQRAKLRTRAIAGCLLLAVALGGVTVLWIGHDRADRRARTTAAVRRSSEEATLLLGQGRWSEARAAVERAREVQAAGEADEVEQDALARLAEQIASEERAFREAAGARRREAMVVDRLQEALAASVAQGRSATEDAYRAAFLALSVTPDQEVGPETVARLRAKRVAPMLAFFLEDWAWRRRTDERSGIRPWRPLVGLSRGIDPEPVRVEIRTALVRGDRDALSALAGRVGEETADGSAVTVATLGHALLRLADPETADGVLAQGWMRHPSSSLLALLRAEALEQHAEPDFKAIAQALATALALRPASVAVDRRLTRSLIALTGAGPEVERTLDTRQPADAAALRRLANTLLGQGDLAGARAALRRIVELQVESPSAWVEHGRLLAGVFHDHPAAIAAYRRALRLDPRLVAAHLGLGDAHRRISRIEDAVHAYEGALRIDTDSLPAMRGLVEAWGSIGRYDEVEAAARRAVELAPTDSGLRNWLGKAQFARGDLDAAEATLEAALATEPGHVGCRLLLARIILFRDEPQRSEPILRAGLTRQPRLGAYHGELAECLLRQGRFGEALLSARRAVALLQTRPPELRAARTRVGLLVGMRDHEAEVRALVERREWPPEEVSLERATVAHFLGLDLTAARMFRIVFERSPDELEEMRAGDRLVPVRTALRVATGRSREALSLSKDERQTWLRRARAWLRADLTGCLEAIRGADRDAGSAARLRLRKWTASRELACVRDSAAREALAPVDAASWQRLWSDVASALATSREPR